MIPPQVRKNSTSNVSVIFMSRRKQKVETDRLFPYEDVETFNVEESEERCIHGDS